MPEGAHGLMGTGLKPPNALSRGARVAVVGSGIAGLAAARELVADFDVTLLEREPRIGGHIHTVTVDEDGRAVPIDTGFMVFNRVTYPRLVRLFDELGIASQPAPMSFSVQHPASGLEFRGTNLNTLFAQRRNLLNPRFLRLLRSINRFNAEAAEALASGSARNLSLSAYASARGYGADFLDLYILPLAGAIWSAETERMLLFPAETLLRFFHNHGFLGLHTHHPWFTPSGGASLYAERLVAPFRDRIRTGAAAVSLRPDPAGIRVAAADGHEGVFDRVVLACHADEAHTLLSPCFPDEAALVAPFRYSQNDVLLHTDARVMPRTRLAWASWNTIAASGSLERPSIHYWMNNLQGVSDRRPYFVTLNGRARVDESRILRSLSYTHPLFDAAAVAAQPAIHAWNARSEQIAFAGSYMRYGFHEDALLGGLSAAASVRGTAFLEAAA